MPQITLSRDEALRLLKFCRDRNIEQFFVAKDSGAYLGASKGEDDNCLFYFKGMNPAINPDYYDTQQHAFGGDDFGEHLPLTFLTKFEENPEIFKVTFSVTATRIGATYAAPPSPDTPEKQKSRLSDAFRKGIWIVTFDNKVYEFKRTKYSAAEARKRIADRYPTAFILNDISIEDAHELLVEAKFFK